MKKKFLALMLCALLSVTLITGCGSKKEEEKEEKKPKTAEELVELYSRAYNEENPELLYEVFPSFMTVELKAYVTAESIREQKEEYGYDAIYSATITDKVKMNDEWLEENNKMLKKYYNTNTQMQECYQLEGTATIKGSLKEETKDIEEMWYCNFDGQWKLIGG